jgi:hypothetical protein
LTDQELSANCRGAPRTSNYLRTSVTNNEGQVILDINADRVKTVAPGVGFGPKRAPTSEELQLLEQMWRP